MDSEYIGCTIKNLPDVERYPAALHAISVNPANAPSEQLVTSSKFSGVIAPTQEFIAVVTQKYWGTAGVHLTVGFMENVAAALQDKIVSYMNKWSDYANVGFTIVRGAAQSADVRISLGGGGYWSYLGTDIHQIPRNQQTMNLQGFSLSTPESEYMRVITHETGHTLGAPHEHLRAEIVARLNEARTIQYFMQTQGWSADEVRQQVLTPISESSLTGATLHAEEDSIMCYGLPASITNDGRAIVGGTKITPDDGKYMGLLYPKAVTPPTNPPPPVSGGFTINVPQQDVWYGSYKFGVVKPYTLTGTISGGSGGDTQLTIPPIILAVLRFACTNIVPNIQPPWNQVLSVVCGLLPANAEMMVAANQSATVQMPGWIMQLLRAECANPNIPDWAKLLCTLVPAQVKPRGCQ